MQPACDRWARTPARALSLLRRPISRVGRFEEVEGVTCRRAEHAWQLRVPMELLDVGLALVDEEELRRDVLQVVAPLDRRLGLRVLLERQVPQRQLVVRTRCL